MTEKQLEPHRLSVVANDLVRHMRDLPGTWDFEKAFQPHIRLMDLESRAAENELSSSSIAANEARVLYLMKRSRELQDEIQAVKSEIAALGK